VHPQNVWPMGEGDVVNGTWVAGEDAVMTYGFPLQTGSQVFTWAIPFGYYNGNNLIPILNNSHVAVFDGQGGCELSKFVMQATRVPTNLANFLNAVKNNVPYTDAWKYTD
jgi:hypothetical protein